MLFRSQLTVRMPFTKTYRIIPSKSATASVAETKADLCAVFPVLPRYPVTLKIWFADEEFPASGKLFLQDHADHYLSVEDAVTVGEILLQKLSEAFSSL